MNREDWIPVIISGLPPNFDYSALRLAFSGPWQSNSGHDGADAADAAGGEQQVSSPSQLQAAAYTSTKGTPAVVDPDFQWWGTVAPFGRFLLTRMSSQGVELFCSTSTDRGASVGPKRIVSFQGNPIRVDRFGTAPGAAEEAGKWVSEVATVAAAGASKKPAAREKKPFGGEKRTAPQRREENGATQEEDSAPHVASTDDLAKVSDEPPQQGFGSGRFQPKPKSTAADTQLKAKAKTQGATSPLSIEEILAEPPQSPPVGGAQEDRKPGKKRAREEEDEAEEETRPIPFAGKASSHVPAATAHPVNRAAPAPASAAPIPAPPKPKVKSVPGSDSCKFCGSNDHLSRRCPNK
jgi:hypothetical protein